MTHELVGKLVRKKSGNNNTLAPKPFKSGKKANTVKEVVVHPVMGTPAYSFMEDDSVVECSRCILESE